MKKARGMMQSLGGLPQGIVENVYLCTFGNTVQVAEHLRTLVISVMGSQSLSLVQTTSSQGQEMAT